MIDKQNRTVTSNLILYGSAALAKSTAGGKVSIGGAE